MRDNKVADNIDLIVELLYQERKEEGYALLPGLLRNISMMVSSIESKENQEEFLKVLKLALDAMEAEDITMVADVLYHEVKPRLGR